MSEAQERALRGLGIWAVVTWVLWITGVLVMRWLVQGLVQGAGTFPWIFVVNLVVVTVGCLGGGVWILLGKPRVWVGWLIWGVALWWLVQMVWWMYTAIGRGTLFSFILERNAFALAAPVGFLWLGWVVLRREWAEDEQVVPRRDAPVLGGSGENILTYERRVVRGDVVGIGLGFVVVFCVVSIVSAGVLFWFVRTAMLADRIPPWYAIPLVFQIWQKEGMMSAFMLVQSSYIGHGLGLLMLTGWAIGLGWYGRWVRARWRSHGCGGKEMRQVGLGLVALGVLYTACMLVQRYKVGAWFQSVGGAEKRVWVWAVNLVINSLQVYGPAVAVYWWLVWPVVKGGGRGKQGAGGWGGVGSGRDGEVPVKNAG